MGYVDGHILRTPEIAEATFTPAQRRAAGLDLVDVLVDLHAVDPDTVGLGALGRRDAYIERQLKRWFGQYQQSAAALGKPQPRLEELHGFLSARTPEQGPATIVHGDYRLDNTILGDDARVTAVLDWELCTLGDPLADVGLLIVYWTDPGHTNAALGVAPTKVEGFPTRAELRARYAERSGRDLSQLDFYVAFSYWRVGCIIEGVWARYAGGAMGGDRTNVDVFEAQVEGLADAAAEAAATL